MLISELSKKLKITTRAIRHYEDKGIIKSLRLINNYRYFDQLNVDKLKFLVRARNLGFSLEECNELIILFLNDNRKSGSVRNIAIKKLDKINNRIKELTDLKKSLQSLVKQCPGNDKPVCPIIDELSK